MNTTPSWRILLLLFIPGALWGSSFLLTEIVLQSMPPITFTMLRNLLTALALWVLLYYQNGRLHNTWRSWYGYFLLGFINTALPFTLISWGQLYIDSGLASILVSTTPIFTIILANFFTDDEPFTLNKLFGILLGFAGIVILIGPAALAGIGQHIGGQLAVTGAAVCYAIGAILSRYYLQRPRMQALPQQVRSLELITGQFLTTALVYIPLALWIDGLPTQFPSAPSVIALLTSAWPMTIIAVMVFYYLIETTGSTYASLSVYLIPLVAVFLGAFVLGEQISFTAIVSLVLILLGVAVVNGLLRINGRLSIVRK